MCWHQGEPLYEGVLLHDGMAAVQLRFQASIDLMTGESS
jgi:hypothetical protein